MSRAAYVSRLRRAFLLRVHPDRFRDDDVRARQATLVKALANRMTQSDFTAWLQHREPRRNQLLVDPAIYPYEMEKRDGSMLKSAISLGKSVDEILDAIANALKRSGAASIPAPTKEIQEIRLDSAAFRSYVENTSTSGTGHVDPRYDVRSNKGRDLKHFLGEATLIHQVRERRADRVDAQAVALQVRRVYQFAAVDATETGWSSASVAVLLRRFLSLHEEFADKLRVASFYPIRLVFSPREIPDDRDVALDLYWGMLLLNPASTSIQWLEELQLVTDDCLKEIQSHRDLSVTRTNCAQGSLGVKLKKGFTCTGREYHTFLERVASRNAGGIRSVSAGSFVPMKEPVHAVVEAESSCRRAFVTSAGLIRLGAGMSETECVDSVDRLSILAREASAADKAGLTRCKDAVAAVQSQLGLHKVYRTGSVSHDEFFECLSRLLSLSREEDQQLLHRTLTGISLGIAATGHVCHMSDDGSVVIPHNWR